MMSMFWFMFLETPETMELLSLSDIKMQKTYTKKEMNKAMSVTVAGPQATLLKATYMWSTFGCHLCVSRIQLNEFHSISA